MGLWIKNEDGSIERAAGGGGSGDGGGPHDHAEYALVEHDHDEFTHTHDDYLPLEGGTLTGDLQVNGRMLVNKGSGAAPGLAFRTGDSQQSTGLFYHADYLGLVRDGDTKVLVYPDQVRVKDADLQVDGQILASRGSATAPGLSFASYEGTGFYPGSTNIATHVNGVWQFVVYEDKTRVIRDLQVDGTINAGAGHGANFGGNWQDARIYNTNSAGREFMVIGNGVNGSQIQLYGNSDSTRPGKVNITGQLLVNGSPLGLFSIAEDIDTADVLDRAETATMPVIDDEGVATTDAEVESITVNEVVTALLAKVKELSARIETLEGN